MPTFSISMDVQQAATTAQVWSGLLTSLCTAQAPDGLLTADGAPSGTFSNVAGLVNIPCMDAVLSAGAIQAAEVRQLEEIMAKSFRHVMLNGWYPQFIPGVAVGWRVIVDGVVYNLMGAEQDSQLTQTRLKCELVTL
jgi:hypothetical protein